MRTAKEIAFISVFTALLIGGQFVLSGISGIEIVTVLLLSFSYYFGIRRGLLVANAFSLLRCFIFGFFVNVIILYLVYYNLFVVVFGILGAKFKKELNMKLLVLIVIIASLLTVIFTVLDDIITPLYYGFSIDTMKTYAIASLAAVVPQVICTVLTVILLLPILIRIFRQLAFFKEN
ncbi:MAG: hypothetical protein HFE25_07730 [Clostridia bacterium]|jgi:hypothetical protein|nr:hypothetical protein [Clostridia bacterium]